MCKLKACLLKAMYTWIYGSPWSVLKGKREESNEVATNAVAIIQTNSLFEETIVGHGLQNISTICSMFLKIPNISIEVEVFGKRVNCEGGHGLEIPVIYRFCGPEKLVSWRSQNSMIKFLNA